MCDLIANKIIDYQIASFDVNVKLNNCRCSYSTKYKIISHDSGPYSSDTCIHAKWCDEIKLAEEVEIEYAKEIWEAKCRAHRSYHSGEMKRYREKIFKAIEDGKDYLYLGNEFEKFGHLDIHKKFPRKYNFGRDIIYEWYLVKQPKRWDWNKYPCQVFSY